MTIEQVRSLSEDSDRYTVKAIRVFGLAAISMGVAIVAAVKDSTIVSAVTGTITFAAAMTARARIRHADNLGRDSEELYNSFGLNEPNPFPTQMSPHIRQDK